MNVVQIGSRTPVAPIEARLSRELDCLHSLGIDINMKPCKTRFFHFLNCSLQYNGKEYTAREATVLTRRYVANVLTDVLVDDWQEMNLKWLINRKYDCFTVSERTTIARLAEQALRVDIASGKPDDLYQLSRKSKVRQTLSDFLEQSNRLVLEGFLRFRLPAYWAEVEDAVDQAVDKFLADKEYHEFVRLLRSFVDILDPKHELVEIAMCDADYFQIFDEKGKLLKSDQLETRVVSDEEGQVSYEDLLISALISLAPVRLVLHEDTFAEAGREDIADTIRHVFEQRVETCEDCQICGDYEAASTSAPTPAPVQP